jgi:hypothetical protein
VGALLEELTNVKSQYNQNCVVVRRRNTTTSREFSPHRYTLVWCDLRGSRLRVIYTGHNSVPYALFLEGYQAREVHGTDCLHAGNQESGTFQLQCRPIRHWAFQFYRILKMQLKFSSGLCNRFVTEMDFDLHRC